MSNGVIMSGCGLGGTTPLGAITAMRELLICFNAARGFIVVFGPTFSVFLLRSFDTKAAPPAFALLPLLLWTRIFTPIIILGMLFTFL